MKFSMIALALLCMAQPMQYIHAGDAEKLKCWDTAMTQMAMNECAGQELQAADSEMHSLYRKLMALPDKAFTRALRLSQRAWLRYRDAQLATYYPDPKEFYGSVRPMCAAQILADLTSQRVVELKRYLNQDEGNVCSPNVDPSPATPHH